jgi:hypothetical protein
MMENTVVVFGAGATKACDGPQTADILPQAYDPLLRAEIESSGFSDLIQREGFVDLLDEFLVANFHLPHDRTQRKKTDYPALTLLMSLIDTAIHRRQPIGPYWVPDRITDVQQQNKAERKSLVDVRQSLEYLIFALLEFKLRQVTEDKNYYLKFLKKLYPRDASVPPIVPSPTVISLNYDIMADNAMIDLSQQWWPESGRFPDYGCEIKTGAYLRTIYNPSEPVEPRYFGKLLKLHGSLNWTYCPGCHRLDLGIANSVKNATIKVRDELYIDNPLEANYSCHGAECEDCKAFIRPILITPTFLKDYRNPHVSKVWYEAERALREATRVIFVGYSLPDDDVNVIYLLKRGLINENLKITVVEYDEKKQDKVDNVVWQRYRSLFGDKVEWWNEGFDKYIDAMA